MNAQNNRSARGQEPASQQQSEQTPATGQAPYSSDYQTRCQEPQGHDDADLCQQWRSANAAEKTAEYARLQYLASVAQAVGLVATLLLSGFATLLSIKAVGIAERDLVGRDRPVLHIEVRKVAQWSPLFFTIYLNITNIGQSPATIMHRRIGLLVARSAPYPKHAWRADVDDFATVTLLGPDVIKPDETLQVQVVKLNVMPKGMLDEVMAPDPFSRVRDPDAEPPRRIYAYGVVTYRDQLDTTRRRHFCIKIAKPDPVLGGTGFEIVRGELWDKDVVGKPDKPMNLVDHVLYGLETWWQNRMRAWRRRGDGH